MAELRLSETIRERFPALASADFRNLVFGQLVSYTGTQMQLVAIAWQLYELTHSPTALGLLGAFRVVPVFLFALGGGVLADALDRRRMMLAAQTAMAAISLVLALAAHGGWASPWLIYGCASVAGAAVAFDTPARQSLVPQLVPREHLPRALGLWATSVQIATIAGPSLAGFLIAHGGATPVYFIDAGSYLAVIGALLTMRYRPAPGPRSPVRLSAVLDGFRFLRRTPIIRTTMVLDFVATFFGGSMLLMPVFAKEILDVGPEGLGLLYAAQPVGAAIAGAAMAAWPLPRRQGLVILWSVVAYGAAVALFGLSRWFWLSLLAMALSGAADTVSMVIRQTLRQLLTPDELRGRMTSVNMMFFMGGPQLGEVEAGIVAGLTSARFSVVSGGLLCIAAVAITALVAPSLRRYVSGSETA